MTGRTWAAQQSRREGRLEGERKKVSGLKSRRGHAVLSSVLTATGPQAAYGNAEGRLKRFSDRNFVSATGTSRWRRRWCRRGPAGSRSGSRSRGSPLSCGCRSRRENAPDWPANLRQRQTGHPGSGDPDESLVPVTASLLSGGDWQAVNERRQPADDRRGGDRDRGWRPPGQREPAGHRSVHRNGKRLPEVKRTSGSAEVRPSRRPR
jgi:hypothetical protein